MSNGEKMYSWARDLFPLCRSITGEGVRRTLHYLQGQIPNLKIYSVPTGTQAFDWRVPLEWNIFDAYVADSGGNRIIDFQRHNLHVLNYAAPINEWMSREELELHLYSIPEQPDAIPYATSYYKTRWGFCLTHNQRKSLPQGPFHVVIDSEFSEGYLNYGEVLLPGQSQAEIFLSTYICHPSMGNNELSGPVVTTALVEWLMSLRYRFYTYRIVFVPETIGSLVYLSQNQQSLSSHVVAGFNITCVGDERCYSYLPSRAANTQSDQAAKHALHHTDPAFKRYTWLDRGSDERQYCAPGIDLPIATIMRSKYGEYPEYHTSLDDLSLITPAGLQGGYTVLRTAIDSIERNVVPIVTVYGEPKLDKRGFYPTLSTRGSSSDVRTTLNLLSYCDGTHTLLDIADLIEVPFGELRALIDQLSEHRLVRVYSLDAAG